MGGLDRKRPQDWAPEVLGRPTRTTEATFRARDVNVELHTKRGPQGNAVSTTSLWSTDPKNPMGYFVTVQFNTAVGLGDMLRQAPTDALYKMRDLIELLLAERSDAKR